MIYLDNAASSWPKPESVLQKTRDWIAQNGANPGRSNHRASREAGNKVKETRQLVADFLQIADPGRIIFCQNATHGLNIVIRSVLAEGGTAVVSSLAHNSVLRPLQSISEEQSLQVKEVSPGESGNVQPKDLEPHLEEHTDLVVLTHGSNLIGALQPIPELVSKIRSICGKSCAVLVDAAQSAGRIPLTPDAWDVDFLAFSGHKGVFGIQGAGVLCVSNDIQLKPLVTGGTGSQSHKPVQPEHLPDRHEAGTASVPAIVSLGAGIRFLLETGLDKIREVETDHAKTLLKEFSRNSDIELYNPELSMDLMDDSGMLPNLLLNFRDTDPVEVSYYLDRKYDIAARAGIHCAPYGHRWLGTLSGEPSGALRVSPGYFNDTSEIEETVRAFHDLSDRLVANE